jgi:hypothetical protein
MEIGSMNECVHPLRGRKFGKRSYRRLSEFAAVRRKAANSKHAQAALLLHRSSPDVGCGFLSTGRSSFMSVSKFPCRNSLHAILTINALLLQAVDYMQFNFLV